MHMHRYKRTCRPHPQCRRCSCFAQTLLLQYRTLYISRYNENNHLASCFVRGLAVQLVSVMAMFSLHSNVNTTVPDSLNRYGREQLPSLSQRERLGGPAYKRGSCSVGSRPSPWAQGTFANASPWSDHHVFAHGPTVLTNQVHRDTKWHFLKVFLHTIVVLQRR